MRRMIAGMAGLGLAAGLAACAKSKNDDAPAGFVPPTNQSRADYLDLLDRHFAKLDRNGDLSLTPEEIPPARAGRIVPFDTDHDARITRDEFMQGSLAKFDQADANRDGVLSSAERRASRGRLDQADPRTGN